MEAAGGPFIRHTQPGRAPIYSVTNAAGGVFSSVITQPLVARPGYFRNFRVAQTVAGTTGTVTMTADSLYALNSLIQLKDTFGTPLIVADGYSVSNLIQVYSGGFGLLNGTNLPTGLASYSAPSAAGNFTLPYALPLEFAKGYGVLSGANASLLPTLQFNIGPSTNIYSSGATTTSTTLSTVVDTDFYWLPEGVAVEPPGLGTTRQWILQQANPTIASASSVRIQLPRLGGYLDNLIFIGRDSTGARTDQWIPGSSATNTSSRIQLYVDGVPLLDTTPGEWADDMNIQYGFNSVVTNFATRPTGTLAVCRKNSLAQTSLGLLDTGEALLSTNPGTLVELNLAPAGTITNSPVTLSVLVGQIVPTGAIIQGLPEV
jgi:hypothetical protein